MPVFADYARYYNLLYRDKDYAGEVTFVLNVLRAYGCVPQTLLDLGCGTGRHALEMARQGIAVTGVDMSETMLALGRETLGSLNRVDFPAPLPELHHGDARAVRLGGKFDAAVSLFHVMSYQKTEEDALAVLETARAHLKPGGFFLFDFWYGPGVLTDPPTAREKAMEDEHVMILRKTTPVQRINDNMVEVHFDITLTDKVTGQETSFAERHDMRYWFMPELRHLAKAASLKPVAVGEWLHMDMQNPFAWNAWVLTQK